jgi:CCR4-NOT transcriptional regulation complex NOT5 subunit
VKLTNNSEGARGVNLKDGTTVWLEPGESRDFDKSEVADNGVHDDFKGNGSSKAASTEPKPLDKMNKAELLATAEAEAVTGAKDAEGKDIAIADATNAQIVTAIEAAREAAKG